jgi:hypothetical protein
MNHGGIAVFPASVWSHLTGLATDHELRSVAEADYGRHADRHLQALLTLRAASVSEVVNGHFPGEVIMLTLFDDDPLDVKAQWPGYLFCIGVSLILAARRQHCYHGPEDMQVLALHLAALPEQSLLDDYCAWRRGRTIPSR